MIVPGCAGSFMAPCSLSVLRVLSQKLCILGLKENLLLCILCLNVFGTLLELFLVATIPIFFYILANGTVWSQSTSFCFWGCCHTGGWLFFLLGLNLYGQFRICSSNIGVGRRNWPISFLTQRGFQTFFPSGQGVLA